MDKGQVGRVGQVGQVNSDPAHRTYPAYPTHQTAWEFLAVLAGAAILTVALTYPLAFRPGNIGRIDTGDGQFSIWNVAWVAPNAVLAYAKPFQLDSLPVRVTRSALKAVPQMARALAVLCGSRRSPFETPAATA